MIKFINRDMGNLMWVEDSRKDEYLKAGHKLAEGAETPEKDMPEQEDDAQKEEKQEKK